MNQVSSRIMQITVREWTALVQHEYNTTIWWKDCYGFVHVSLACFCFFITFEQHLISLNGRTHLSIVSDLVHPIILMTYTNDSNRRAMVLVFCNYFRYTKAISPCLGGLDNNHVQSN